MNFMKLVGTSPHTLNQRGFLYLAIREGLLGKAIKEGLQVGSQRGSTGDVIGKDKEKGL